MKIAPSNILSAVPVLALTSGTAADLVGDELGERQVTAHSEAVLQSVDGSASAKTLLDPLILYGGQSKAPEGMFQDQTGVVPDAQGWIGIDQKTDRFRPAEILITSAAASAATRVALRVTTRSSRRRSRRCAPCRPRSVRKLERSEVLRPTAASDTLTG
jgi:hypothetical protein